MIFWLFDIVSGLKNDNIFSAALHSINKIPSAATTTTITTSSGTTTISTAADCGRCDH